MPVENAAIVREALAALNGGPPVAVATVISGPEGPVEIGAKLLLRGDGSILGSFGRGPLEAAVVEAARETLQRHGIETFYFAVDGRRLTRLEAEGQRAYEVMIEPHEAPAKLLIVGGGHIGKALAEIGKLCGFHVAVIDDRPEYANRDRFPDADEVIRGRFVETLRDYPIDASTYVVCVTRGHKQDEVSLRQVVEKPARYVGMIGSRRRVSAVLQHIVEDGAPPEAVARVHTPIGLDIGAETPEEIAVAIMAEVLQVRRGGTGLPMREVKKPKRGVAPAERVPPGED